MISQTRTFDALPCWEAEMKDLATDVIKLSYLPLAIDQDILEQNHRDFKQQLASLRLYDLKHDKPTNAGVLLFGHDPKYFLFGAYIQYIKTKDIQKGNFDKIELEKVFKGNLFDVLRQVDEFVKNVIIKQRTRPIENSFRDRISYNYPYFAVREMIMNAIMHRNYESNSPIYIYDFADRIEINNAGGLYGKVNKQTFPDTSDYRNPILAEAMFSMKFVNRFNFGINRSQQLLAENGNPAAEFDLSSESSFSVSLKMNPEWQKE